MREVAGSTPAPGTIRLKPAPLVGAPLEAIIAYARSLGRDEPKRKKPGRKPRPLPKDGSLPALTAAEAARFWRKVRRGEPGECWPWVGGTSFPATSE